MEERLERGTLVEVDDYKAIFERGDENVLKFLATSSSRAKLVRAKNELNEIGNLAVSSSSAGNIELTHENAQKGIDRKSVVQGKRAQPPARRTPQPTARDGPTATH